MCLTMKLQLPFLTAWLATLTVFAQTPAPPEVKLRTLICPAPALIGHLGDPTAGQPSPIQAFQWHPSDRILSSQKYDDYGGQMTHLGMWERDAAFPRLLFRGMLDVGGNWCMTTKGDLLFAQSESRVDRPGLRSPFGSKAGALGCFRWSDGRRLWSLPCEDAEPITDLGLSMDDRVLVVVTSRRSVSMIHLHDPVTGKELSRGTLAGGEVRVPSEIQTRRLVVRANDVLMVRLLGTKEDLVRIPLATLEPETIPLPWIDGKEASLTLSPDGHWLALLGLGGYDYAVLEDQAGKWSMALSGTVTTNFYRSITGDEISSLSFSPNSRSLAVITANQVRVIDLASHKVVHKFGEGCTYGAFSPDGATFATAMHSSTALWNTHDWKPVDKPNPPVQHSCPVKGLQFLSDGRTLLSWDQSGLILWDVATRKARAELRPKNKAHLCAQSIDSIALMNRGTEVVTGDGWDFIRWRLPPLTGPAPAQPAAITSELAFPGPPSQAEAMVPMSVVADPEGQHVVAFTKSYAAIHDLRSPGVVKTVQMGTMYPGDTLATFSPDGKFLSYVSNISSVWQRINLATGDTSHLPKTGVPVDNATLILPKSGAGLWNHFGTVTITDIASGEVLQSIGSPSPAMEIPPGRVAAATEDERRVAVPVRNKQSGQYFIGLWERKSGTLLALQPLPSNQIACMAFSPDGKILACGHHHTAISLWDVEQLLQTAKPELVIPPQVSQVPAPALVKRQALPPNTIIRHPLTTLEVEAFLSSRLRTELPAEPQPVHEGEMWTFLPDGVISMGERLPAAGRLLASSVKVVSQSVRYNPQRYQGIMASPFDPGRCIVASEGPALNGKLWVSRQIGNPPGTGGTAFTDVFTNVSAEPVSTGIDFEVQFPSDTKELLDSNFKRVVPDAAGHLALDPSVRWLAPYHSGRAGEAQPVLCFQSMSRDKQPRVLWDAPSHSLRVQHDLLVGPGEKRYMAHILRLVPTDPQQPPGSIGALTFDDFSTYVAPSTRERGINFGRLASAEELSGSFHPRPAYPQRDQMGFEWLELPDLSREGQLGAQSVFQLWIDRKPLPFSGASLFLHLDRYARRLSQTLNTSIRGQMLDGNVAITRYPVTTGNNNTVSVWNDLFTNTSDKAVECKISLVTSFATAPVELWDAHGKNRPLDHQELSGSDLGGACAVVSPGDQKPATLLVFHREGSTIDPHLRWIGDRMVAVEYTLSIPPHGAQLLRHGACQRPLGAFKSPADAMADCVPLRPESFPAALRITNLPSPANYHQ